jgi:hypothetical protein
MTHCAKTNRQDRQGRQEIRPDELIYPRFLSANSAFRSDEIDSRNKSGLGDLGVLAVFTLIQL